MAIGAIERRQGKWAQSTENYERAALLSPNDAYLLENLGNNYRANKNFEKADKLADRAIKIAPNALGQRQVKATLAMELKGDFSEMEKQLALVPPGVDPEGLVTLARVNAWILQRKFAAALAALKQLPQEAFYDRPPSPMPKAFLEGILYTYLNDKEKARSAFEHARPIAEQALQESPDDASRHAMLGQILAGLGQKEKAIAEGKRAVEILPESKDALDGPQMTVWLAQIYAWTGEYDQALQLLDHSLSTPNGITAPILKLDPVWDPLRGDPRFQKLCEEKQK
jgi:serine/threonine-protein kinase